MGYACGLFLSPENLIQHVYWRPSNTKLWSYYMSEASVPMAQLSHVLHMLQGNSAPSGGLAIIQWLTAFFFSVYRVTKTSIKSHHLGGGRECGEICGRVDFPLKLKCAGLDIFLLLFFFFCCTGEKKVLFLLERFPAYTMFPGNLYRPMPIFITCRRNRITRWRFWKGM